MYGDSKKTHESLAIMASIYVIYIYTYVCLFRECFKEFRTCHDCYHCLYTPLEGFEIGHGAACTLSEGVQGLKIMGFEVLHTLMK